MFKANQAYSGDCITILKFRTKWSWQLPLNNEGIDAVIDEEAAAYQTFNFGHSHDSLSS
jgi:hypothetical protein